MKSFIFICCLFVSSIFISGQQPNGIFPPGSVYTYNVFPLDSLNNRIVSEMFYRRDKFADVADYEGKLANIFLTKKASTTDSLEIKPYLDSLLYHYDGTNGFEYFQTRPLEGFLNSLDSIGIDPNFNFLSFFRSLQDWYSLYRFNAALNEEYTLLSVDTSVSVFNVRFEYIGERFPDEIISTNLGDVNSKKFLISWKFSVFFINWQPLLSTQDTVWVAPGNEFWITKDIVPTNHIDLSFFGIDPFSIPGLETGDVVVPVEGDNKPVIPIEIVLEQNYPNPFNPSTSISYKINNAQYVSLKIYDVIGNEVATLVDEYEPVGVYNVEWNASNYPSGVYFYQLKTEGFVETKKMILMK